MGPNSLVSDVGKSPRMRKPLCLRDLIMRKR